MNVDTVPRTLLVAAGVALFCSAIVSLAVHGLRPRQAAYELVERNRAILVAANRLAKTAGSPDAAASPAEVVTAYLDLDARVVDLQSGWFTDTFDGLTYDHWQRSDDPTSAQPAKARFVPVYLVRKADHLEQIVLPVDGQGMWSNIFGYIALGPDFNEVTGVTFHRHGETPGIGDRIQDPAWLETWRGKRIRDDDDVMRFTVSKGAAGPFEVDVISGASVTSEATGTIVRHWLGADGFEAFLNNLTQREKPQGPSS